MSEALPSWILLRVLPFCFLNPVPEAAFTPGRDVLFPPPPDVPPLPPESSPFPFVGSLEPDPSVPVTPVFVPVVPTWPFTLCTYDGLRVEPPHAAGRISASAMRLPPAT